MKIKLTLFSAACLALVACKGSTETSPQSGAPIPEIRGEAILKITEPTPEAPSPSGESPVKADPTTDAAPAPEVTDATIPAGDLITSSPLDARSMILRRVTEVDGELSADLFWPPQSRTYPGVTVGDTLIFSGMDHTVDQIASDTVTLRVIPDGKSFLIRKRLTTTNTVEASIASAPAPEKGADEKEEAKSAPTEASANVDEVIASVDADETELFEGEFRIVNFDKLASFEYEVPEEEYDPDKKPDPSSYPDQIPDNVKVFHKKRVALKGFMLPLKVEDGLITELLIMRDQSMCCYGSVPKINEWVSVRMTGKGIKPIMDQVVTIYGRLKVGEIRENGYLVGIYEMDGEKMTGPLDL